jgi:hypothetical protein
MLTGTQPFAAESREQMIRRRLHEPPPHVRDVLPDLPHRLDTLIVHMLARSPADRLASASVARDALDPSLALGSWDPTAITGPRPTPITAADWERPAGDPSMQPTAIMPRRRAGARRIVGGLAVVAILIAGGGIWWSQRATARPRATVRDTTHVVMAPAAVAAESARGPLPVLDSSRLAPKTAAPSPDEALHAPFAELASAINSGSLQVLKAKYPALPESVERFLTTLHGSYDAVRARVTFGVGTVNGDRGELPVTIHLTYRAKGTGTPQRSEARMVGRLVRKGGKWTIEAIKPAS